MEQFIGYIKKNKWLIAFALLLFLTGFLRFMKLEEFITYLGDQGRDAMAVKRIVTGEDIPGIGPRSSIGQVYLGPFFFYLMAPFMGLFQLNPLGLAWGVAFLSTICTGLITIYLARQTNVKTALAFLSMAAISYILVEFSRFGWNPNLLPYVSFGVLIASYHFALRPKLYLSALFGLAIGISIQLHYLFLIMLPLAGGMYLYGIVKRVKGVQQKLLNIGVSIIATALPLLPFIAFEIRNDFLNTRGLFDLFGEKQFQSQTSFFEKMETGTRSFFEFIVPTELPIYSGLLFFTALIAFTVWLWKHPKKNWFFIMNACTVWGFFLLFSLVDTIRIPHYYMPIYIPTFILLAAPFYFSKKKWVLATTGLVTLIIAGLNIPRYAIYTQKGNFQTRIAQSIAGIIRYENIERPYFLVAIPGATPVEHLAYYMEIWGMPPTTPESIPAETAKTDIKTLVILCYDKQGCNVMDEPQYSVVIFGDRVIDKIVRHPEVTIYFLSHAKKAN